MKTFTLQVVSDPGSGTLQFTYPPPESVLLGGTYAYNAVATDTADYPLTYSLVAPYPSGMSFVSGTTYITWMPTAAQVGDNTVNIEVSDGVESLIQTFVVAVTDQESDQPPTITPPPSQYAIVGDLYQYSLTATDPGNYPLSWTLGTRPAGMVLDPSTNSLIWTPTANQANTTPSVTVEVSDGQGGFAGETFSIDVLAADLPPVFANFDPPIQAGAGVAYAYQVQAHSPDSLPLTYSVTAAPANSDITISSTGLLQWPGPSGDGETITVEVKDLANLSATETYNLTVSSTPPGIPPVFNPPAPPAYAAVGCEYSCTPSVTSTAGDTMYYNITSSPYVSDLYNEGVFDTSTGAIDWTPTTGDYGPTQPISITITAVDNTVGMDAFMTFPVTVTTDSPPAISSGAPPSTLTAGQTFIYQVQASDPDGDVLTYSLLGQPSGMAIDSSGRITWPTTASNIGDYSYQVVVTSPAGLSQTSPPYSLDVSADTTAPTVQLEISSNPADVGSVVYFDVIASDNVGVTSIGLTIGGTPVVLGENGQGQYTASTLGEFSVVATASNAAGLSSQSTATLSVIDPTDTSAPTVSIASPSDGATITSPTEVVGTVSDSHILSWTLAEAPVNSNAFTTIASGTSDVDDADLGLFDPTTLADGAYTLELTAWNAGGHVSTTSITVNVSGYLKLGNLDLSFTDLSIPLAGIPITITRTYNSLNADTSSDFGYGWTLSETDYQLSVNTLGNGLGSFDDYVPLEAGNRVVVTLPDGTEEGFTFEPQAVTDPWGLVVEYYTPYFQPDTGVTDTLTVQPVDLSVIPGTNEYYGGDDDDDYNPAEAEFGGSYTLTNESGIATTFDATTGQVLSESDRHGNTLTFDSSGIYSNTGLAVTFDRDSQGRITEITDPDGHSILYGYDTAGDLTSVTDRDGNVTSFAYGAPLPHFLTQITDGMGNVVMSAQYSPDGRITQITNATGSSDSLSYNLSDLSESATAPGNTNPTTNTYTSEGLLAKSVDADGNETDYTYVDNFLTSETQVVGGNDLTTNYVNNIYGQPTQETDPAGNTTYYTYDQYGDPQTESDIYGDTTSFSYYYDADNSQDPMNGDLMSTTDPLGSTSEFTYDDAGDVHTTMTDAGTADAATTTNVYNQYGDLMSTTTPQGVTTSNTYDADGNLLTSKWVWVNPNDTSETDAEKTLNSYDGNGNLKGTQTSANGVVQTTTSSLYDADNRVYSSTDELGGVTTTVYDVNGNVIQTTTPDGMVTDSVYNALGQVTYTDDAHLPGMPTDGTLTEYDQDGNVIGTENLANVVITVTMTGLDTGTSVLTSAGTILSSTSTTYNAAGEVTQTVDASGMVTNNTYDKVGNLLTSTETVDGVSRMTSSTYNKIGEVTSTTDALGNTTQYQYNAAGQVTVTTFADGSSITDEYDTQGNKIAEIDQNGLETQYQYNAYGELTEVIEPSMMDLDPNDSTYRQPVTPTYHYGYDNYGDQTSTTDAQGNTTTYAFNSTGNMVSETLPMGGANGTEYWTYNPLGELTEFVDFDGNETDYAYNDLGQVRQKTVYAYSDLTTPYETVGYQYNVNYETDGSYEDIVDDSIGGITVSTYDVNGNLVELQSPQGTINYAYDQATGNEIEVSTSNTATYYSYDPAGELTQVKVTELDGQPLSSPLVTGYSYDADGNLISTQNANGTTETRKYNDLNELTSIADSGPWGEYAGFAYTYDLAGHVLTETDYGGWTAKYSYDALYRLIGETISDPDPQSGVSTYQYTYDLVGNRVSETDTTPAGSVTQTSIYNANGELTSVTNVGTGDVQNYSYDANGNTTEITDGDNNVIASYTWDPQGRMTGATTGGNAASYTYDDAGNRTSETVNDQTTKYLNDPNQAYDQVLEEYAPGGVLAATYIRGIDLLFQQRVQSGVGALSFYVTDNLGSTRALTDLAGAVTDTYNYDAFGDVIGGTQVTPNEFLYAGMQYDSAIGQYYDRARYYDASAGQFTSRDSYGGQTAVPSTENRYLYTGSDPTNGVDPSGNFDVGLGGLMVSLSTNFSLQGLAAGAVVGGIYGGARGFLDAATGDDPASLALATLMGALRGGIFGAVLGGIGPVIGGISGLTNLTMWAGLTGTSVISTGLGVYESYQLGLGWQAGVRFAFGILDTALAGSALYMATAPSSPSNYLGGRTVTPAAWGFLRATLSNFGINIEQIAGFAQDDPSSLPVRGFYIPRYDTDGQAKTLGGTIKLLDSATWYDVIHEVLHAVVDAWSPPGRAAGGPRGTEQMVFGLEKMFFWNFLNGAEKADAAKYAGWRRGNGNDN